ncbi:threonine dehydrogenase-like Zn-dependent dehydrogenase [Streptomyces nodosus]|uniref:2-deoxy-scyllo-inosamine dehydrogenase n=1 Tax=Streptomyces nodosus TaxID=40318 RepID=A0A5P2VVI9_9ACTN|nr:alcohol dehydrogenase catalytic domain-containing protein [Streptomyces nodosus]MBB4796261.1 threonine dehydrogenase-like Zn-dependent dehydrogenase [Streptomyces nodosus]QEV37205.1 cyclitolreductase [Streptomyces nodosus]
MTLEEGGPRLHHSPPPRPREDPAVLVNVELAALCRSDLKEVAGTRHGPSQFGHELVGVVCESTVPALAEGTRVVLDPNVVVDRGTGFADQMWAAGPADLLRHALQPVPHGPAARRLVFAEPIACAQHCLSAVKRQVGGLHGARVAVLGAGTAGLFIAALADRAGARVSVCNRSRARMDEARKADLLDVPALLFGELAGESADVVVVATSFVLPAVLEEALRLVAPGGLVLLYGGTAPGDRHPGLECDLDRVRRTGAVATCTWRGRSLRVAGSYGTNPQDFAAAIGNLTDVVTPLRAEALVAAEVDLPGLFELLGTPDALGPGKIVVHPRPF